MGSTKKPRKPRRARLSAIPMMQELHDQFAMQLHVSLMALRVCPSTDHFDAIAQIFNVVSLTIEDDKRFIAESRILAGGARAMQDIDSRFKPGDEFRPSNLEIAPIEPAVNVVDHILMRLDVSKLYMSMQRLSAMRCSA